MKGKGELPLSDQEAWDRFLFLLGMLPGANRKGRPRATAATTDLPQYPPEGEDVQGSFRSRPQDQTTNGPFRTARLAPVPRPVPADPQQIALDMILRGVPGTAIPPTAPFLNQPNANESGLGWMRDYLLREGR